MHQTGSSANPARVPAGTLVVWEGVGLAAVADYPDGDSRATEPAHLQIDTSGMAAHLRLDGATALRGDANPYDVEDRGELYAVVGPNRSGERVTVAEYRVIDGHRAHARASAEASADGFNSTWCEDRCERPNLSVSVGDWDVLRAGGSVVAHTLHAYLYPEQYPPGDDYHDADHPHWDGYDPETEKPRDRGEFEWSAETPEVIAELLRRWL